MAEQTEEVKSNTPTEGKGGKTLLYMLAVIPIVIALSYFSVTKLINPRLGFRQVDTENATLESKESKYKDKNGIICEIGSVLANPLSMEYRRIVKVNVSVEVPSKSIVKEIENSKKKLQHQVLMALSSQSLESLVTPEGKSKLQVELKKRFAEELGSDEGKIYQVYFTEFVIQ